MDNYGWDTIFAVKVAQANAILAKNMERLVIRFSFDRDGINLDGTFGAWKIVSGGSDQLLNIEAPVTSGTLRALGTKHDLAGITPVMQVQLAFFDKVGSTNVRDLKFNFKVKGAHAGDTTPGAVTTINPDTSGKITQSDPAWAILHDYLPEVFIEHQSTMSFAFAALNLVPPETASWLAPKEYVYVYDQPAQGGDGYIGILCTLSDRDVSHLKRALDPALMNGGHDLSFLISQSLFLQHVIMPGLPKAYGHGASAGNFKMSGGKIVNHGRLSCGSVKEGLVYYHPHIDHLKIWVDTDEILSSSAGSFDITGLTDAYVSFSTKLHAEVAFDKSSEKISLTHIHTSKDYSKHIPWWERVIAIIGGPIILAIVDVVIELVTNAVASSVTKSVAGVGGVSMANLEAQTVKWNGLHDFQVTNAGLATNFYLRGSYK